jgi:hypothetical protein
MADALLPAYTVAALLLVIAGCAKLAAPDRAHAALATARIRVPVAAVRALGALEVVSGVAALAGFASPLAVAYACFLAFSVRLLRAGGAIDCGCFGREGATIGPAHVAFNAAALCVCVLAALLHGRSPGSLLAADPLVAFTTALGVVAATCAAYLLLTAFPRAWRAYGS